MEIMLGVLLVHLFRFGGYLSVRLILPLASFGWVAVANWQERSTSRYGWRRTRDGMVLLDPGLSTWIGMFTAFPILIVLILRTL